MAINNITGFPGNQSQRATDGSQVQVARSEPTASQQQTGRPSTMDTVSLTDTAARLRDLENSLAKLPVVDSQRVETIQQAIASGSYEMDAGRTAEKMLKFEQDLQR
ncbi:MAG: flagellar biosynthesis anti-sigma factor FlgM [Gammaproteobacteria bacterium HGW-Gammaproteobacteria-1]|jgi:negative regulator of flagellin synthesis FlgM|nr:MAG: flagellar biosynthesis anti-sigma factor FlgM [Gammaproteobacteria bacterium HGW-Gammaproteobacteria-1]